MNDARDGNPDRPAVVFIVSLTVSAWLCVPSYAAERTGVTWGPGPEMSIPRSDFKIKLAGYVQADFRAFPDWNETIDADDPRSFRSDTTELRRTRVGFEGEWRRLSFEFIGDLQEYGRARLKDAFLDLRLSSVLRMRAGHFKLPLSQERLTSAAKTDFIERSLLAEALAPGRDLGLMLYGEPSKQLLYQVGVFAGDDYAGSARAETTSVARLVITPFKGFDIGGAASIGDVDAGAFQAPAKKSFRGVGPSGYEYSPRFYVEGRRQRLDVSAAFNRGPFGIKLEGLQGREQRSGQGASFCTGPEADPACEDLSDFVGTGWAASATWLITGEKKTRTITPARSAAKGPGAIEIGLRYESLRFDDDGPKTEFAGVSDRARDIQPLADHVLTGGISWWPAGWARVMANIVIETYEDPLLAPEVGRKGRYVSLLGRLQLAVP